MDELIARLEAAALRHFYLLAAFAGCACCYLLFKNGFEGIATLGASAMLISAADRLDKERAALRARGDA